MVHHNLQSQDMQQMALIVDLQKKARAAKGFAILSFLIALSALVVAFVQ
ncbi:hypothetical protein [uncultured Veillonella sp.]|nr:hypothetical protein [uncultured Veillonella sp.]